jgi:hypothetical protein
MRPNHIFALGLAALLALILYILEYDGYSILLCTLGVLLGSALPGLDNLFKGYWGHLKVLTFLFAGVLVYFAYSGPFTTCFYLIIPYCENLIFLAVILLTALFFVFDLMNPLSPPLHSLIPLALFTIAYGIALLYLRQPPAASFVSLCGFFLGYFGQVNLHDLKAEAFP